MSAGEERCFAAQLVLGAAVRVRSNLVELSQAGAGPLGLAV